MSSNLVQEEFLKIDFPLDEALHTRFMCSVGNKVILKALFNVNNKELIFTKAIAIAVETDEAAKVAKGTMYGSKPSPSPVNQIWPPGRQNRGRKGGSDFPYGICPHYEKNEHKAAECPFIDAVCYFCNKTGYLEMVCLKKKKSKQQSVNTIKHRIQTVKEAKAVPQLKQAIKLNRETLNFEVDTGAGDNFCAEAIWKKLERLALTPATSHYEVTNGQPLPTLQVFTASVALQDNGGSCIPLNFTVAKIPWLNLLGCDTIVKLSINVSALKGVHSEAQQSFSVKTIHSPKADLALQEACKKLCQEFPDLFKTELKCLKDFQL